MVVEKIPSQIVISDLNKATTLVFWQDLVDAIESTGVVVDDDEYDTLIFKDRVYDVRSFRQLSVQIENTGANAIDVTILGATKNFDVLATDLAIGDYDIVLSAEEEIAAAAVMSTAFENVRTTPLITAIVIRAKEAVDANPGKVRADIKFQQ